MSVRFKRQKPGHFLLRFIYNLNKIPFMPGRKKFHLFLDLEWIFGRLAHEASFFHYPNMQHPIRVKAKRFLLDGINSESTVLDLGCNQGENASLIAQKAKEVVGVDFNAQAIEKAKAQFSAPNLSFVHGEAIEYVSANKGRFNTLVLSHILEHIDDQRAFLMSFRSFFKHIYIELPDLEASFLNQYRIDLDARYQHTDDDHVVEFDREDLRNLLNECGLRIVSSEYIYGMQKYWCEVEPQNP
ncbi:MAG: Methyltransferase type 12 [Bacteroidetes bacterium]|nr:Methyltransferase type 12 [Bacteroidota bacterium]